MLGKFLFLSLIYTINSLDFEASNRDKMDKYNFTKNFSKDKHNDLFLQSVKMDFFENMNDCLNNDNTINYWSNDFNEDCECQNSTQCLDTLFTSNDFRKQKWLLNNTFINGSQCEFKLGRVCDLCGDYPVKAHILLVGETCLNYPILRFLMALLILFTGILFTLSIVMCMNRIISNSDGTTIIRRRYGYRRIVNNSDKPPNYTQNN